MRTTISQQMTSECRVKVAQLSFSKVLRTWLTWPIMEHHLTSKLFRKSSVLARYLLEQVIFKPLLTLLMALSELWLWLTIPTPHLLLSRCLLGQLMLPAKISELQFTTMMRTLTLTFTVLQLLAPFSTTTKGNSTAWTLRLSRVAVLTATAGLCKLATKW